MTLELPVADAGDSNRRRCPRLKIWQPRLLAEKADVDADDRSEIEQDRHSRDAWSAEL